MREIKFRAWHYEEGNPVYTPEMRYSQTWNLSLFFQNVDSEPCSVEVMQYTGLKDKRGKEIYKGDILKIDISQISHVKTISTYEVVWNEDIALGYGWGAYNLKSWGFLPLDGFGEYELIGNIYENPELLEVK